MLRLRSIAGRSAVCGLAAAVALVGCGHAAHPTAAQPGSSRLSIEGANGEPTISARVAATLAAADTGSVALRRSAEMLFGHHVLLLMDLMRARQRHEPAAVQAAATAAVSRNSADIAALVKAAYGNASARAVRQQWDAHVGSLLAYSDAVGVHDAAAKQAARGQLRLFEQRLARILTSAIISGAAFAAVGGQLSKAARYAATAKAAERALQMHVDMLLAQVDAYAANDPAKAYAVQHAAFAHMISFADTLAAGIVESRGTPPADFNSPRRRLQTALGKLLGEHMGLMVNTMQAGVLGRPDFRASGTTLNANTAELAGAVGALYGRPDGQRFLSLWAQHVDALTAYTAATARGDAPGKATAKRRLDQFATGLAAFLASATERRLQPAPLTAAITMHDLDLVRQLDAYAAHDYAGAENIAYAGYQHMFTLAQQLAEAIGNTVAARLPRGGAETGGGGTATRRR